MTCSLSLSWCAYLDLAKLQKVPSEIPGLGPSSMDSARLPRPCVREWGVCPGDSSCRWADRRCVCFTWNWAQKVTELLCLCSGRRSQAKQTRQQKSKVCSLTHDFPTFVGAAGLTQPETLCMLSIINWLWWNLLFKQWSSVLKTKILDWLGSFLSNILNWKLHSFLNEGRLWEDSMNPQSLWRVETRGHKTCPALFFVLDSQGQLV